MSQSLDNASLCQKTQKLLKEFGYEVKLGHLYEVFSKLNGQPSWNHAKAKSIPLVSVIDFSALDPAEIVPSSNSKHKSFDVKVVCGMHDTLEIKKYYRIYTSSEYKARKIVGEYLNLIHHEDQDGPDEFTSPEALSLWETEGPDRYKNQNWEVIWNEKVGVLEEQTVRDHASLWDYFLDYYFDDGIMPMKLEAIAQDAVDMLIDQFVNAWSSEHARLTADQKIEAASFMHAKLKENNLIR